MKMTTDPRNEIKEILNMFGFDCVNMTEITRGKSYLFTRKCDGKPIGTLKKEKEYWEKEYTWTLDAWKFEVQGMEYKPVNGHLVGYDHCAWYAENEPVTTVKTAMAYFKGVAEMAGKIQNARNTAIDMFNHLIEK